MEDKANIPFDYERFKRLELEGSQAAEDLLRSINESIARYDLSPDAVVCLLSRISSGYIHQMQVASGDIMQYDIIEDQFHEMFQVYLGSLERQDIDVEMERMERRNLN